MCRHDRRGVAGWSAQQVFDVGTSERDGEVEPVEQRSREPAQITLSHGVAAPARPGEPPFATGTRIHGPHQQEAGREVDGAAGAPDPDDVLFEWLTERVEHGGRKLPQLVEEEDSGVGQRDLAGPEPRRPATDDGHLGGAVVGGTKRRSRREHRRRGGTGGGVDSEHLERLVAGEIGEDPGEAVGEHGLARARCPHQQQVMTPGGGDLESTPGDQLTPDVEEVGLAAVLCRRAGQRAGGAHGT